MSDNVKAAEKVIMNLTTEELNLVARLWEKRKEQLQNEFRTNLRLGDVVELHNAKREIGVITKMNRKTCQASFKENDRTKIYKLPLTLIARKIDDEKELMLLKLADTI